MQPNFTQQNFGYFCSRIIAFALIFSAATQISFAQQNLLNKAKQTLIEERVQQRLKNIELSKNSASVSAPSVGRAPVQIGANTIIPNNPNAGNPLSRAFCYNGPAGAFQLNKQSVLNTVLTTIGAPFNGVFPGATAWVTTTNKLYEIDQGAPFGLYTVDTVTGIRTFVVNCTGVPQANLTGMTWDATTNTMYGASTTLAVSQIFTMNIVTGVCTPIGAATAVAPGVIMINAAPGGTLFSVDIVTDNLYRWNKTTGVPTLVGAMGVDVNFGQDGHFDPSDGQYYWGAIGNGLGASLRIIDTITAGNTLVGAYPGQVETFAIFSAALTPCSGAPNPGNTLSSANPVCPTVPFSLSLENNPAVSGLTYQWQSAPAVGGPWTNIPGATGASYATNITVATAYRCNVSCSGGPATASNPLLVSISPPSNCYCNAGADDMFDEKISRVRYNTIDNPSTSTAGYENFTAISTTVIQGSTQNITVDISNFFTGDLVRVWIDFNQNGTFEASERVVATTNTAANPAVGAITIPVTSLIGPTRMRVRMYWSPSDPDPGPCGNTAYGQVEDYTVNIQPCIQGVFTTHPANQTIQCGGNASFSVATNGSLLTYGWEYKISAASPFWLNVTNGGVYSGATTNTLTITNAPQTMNGYVYRATMIGPCTAIDFSNSATLTVGPYILNVVPPSASICTDTIQQLTITNTVSAPVTSVFSSGAINMPIPDANLTGINHTIPVSGISGLITDVSVRFSIPAHTWPGDLVVALRGPGGQILNLDYFITNTGAGPGLGMINTNMSSNGVVKLNTSTSPYTGTFAPDAQLTATANGPIGPTGFQTPVVGTYQGLVNFANGTTANGNWTIAIYDGFGGDIGSLTNWQVSITYAAPVFAQGVWTSNPAAPNTMWATAAGPAGAPYVAGSLATTIWVAPAVNTTYSVVVTTATPCVSAPTLVPVTVSNPVTIAAIGQPTNKTACVGTNTSFSVTAGGGPLTYQWQVSVDGGITYTNIAGATAATLNLTGVTQVMNNNLYRVIVTAGPCGSTTSATARLNINPLPTVTISSNVLQLVPGRVATITGSSSPAPFSTTSWSWTRNGVPIVTIPPSNTNSISANIDQQGAYRATVTDINGCVNSSNIVTIISEVSDYLWIYPNPNIGQFQVRLYYNGAQAERRIVRIYNMTGELVAQKEFDLDSNTQPYLSMNFDLPLLSSGTYAVKVVDRNGKRITSGLMVIQ